ncbi:MAG TPA: type IV secretion system DNA-binding domain-containing protein [Candidatus Paceibacterota bacterium]|nr:type IV secretion system DNA-binding domain-containing protein [Candidatus Paceibacterota bacterium]
MDIFSFLFFFLIAVILGVVFTWARKKNFSALLSGSLKMSLLVIKLPPEVVKADEKRPLKERIAVAEQFLTTLSSLKKPAVLEIALPHIGEEIYFYLAVAKESVNFVQRQIQGFYPNAFVALSEDYNIFNPTGETVSASLKLKEPWLLPIRTYQELEADPISPILNAFSKLEKEGEGMVFQIVLQPASKAAKKSLEGAIKKMRQGTSLKDVLGGRGFKDFGQALAEAVKPQVPDKNQEKPKTIDEIGAKALESKINKNLFSVNLRFLASAQTKSRAEEIVTNVLGSFNQFGSPTKNEFVAFRPRNQQKLIFNYSFRAFNPKESIILNSEEIASFWHFPNLVSAAPYATWVKSKEAPPPAELPEEGLVLGQSIFRGEEKTVRLTAKDRRRHVYLIGQTGTGKSYAMTNSIIQDIKNGAGVGVVDPHGDLIDQILEYIPKERMEDVILFDPADLERPMGLNMLEYDFSHPEQKTFITNEFINIFDKLYDLKATGGPMFEYYLRNALSLLMSDTSETPTLLDIPRVFTNEEFRNQKLARCSDPTTVEFWEKEAAKVTSGDISLSNIAPYITSKFNTFISNDYVRPIISQTKSAFNFREVMDNRKILLINLSKGRIGDLNSSLLGLIMVGKLLMAALSRVDTPEDRRQDFYLYIDEFQNFATSSIATILAEARKYRLDLTIAHQFIAQLDDKIREAVFGNVGTMLCFRVGAKDAEFLVKYFEPVFDQSDLINIDNFNAIIKLLIKDYTSRPFNIKIPSREVGDLHQAALIRDLSRLKYGADRLEVESAIRERYLG